MEPVLVSTRVQFLLVGRGPVRWHPRHSLSQQDDIDS